MRLPVSRDNVAFFVPSLRVGGAERVVVNLARGMVERGVALDLVMANREGPLLSELPPQVRVIDLATIRMRAAVFGLAKYLREAQPAAILSHMNHANLTTIAARMLSRTKTRVVVVEHSNLTGNISSGTFNKLIPPLMRCFYPLADEIVAVSDGVARDLEKVLCLPCGTVKTIYNPIVDDNLYAKCSAEPGHPWLHDRSTPLFLAVGRLHAAKDYPTLLRAFEQFLRKRPARLLIFGEGSERAGLELLAENLCISDRVSMPGFTDNPYNALRHATALILSSRYEGFGNVLVEAMACGCPVVSTDCPSGPREILEGGRHGLLVAPGDPIALAAAMLQSVACPPDKQLLVRRAAEFSTQKATALYLVSLRPEFPRSSVAQAA